MSSASSIADKYITRDGRVPDKTAPSTIVWAPIAILDKELEWLTKAVLRGGYIPTRDRDGDAAPLLTELRTMMERGLIKGIPWRITKFGRDCLRELEAKPVAATIFVPSSPPLPKSDSAPIAIRALAEIEREMIEGALSQFGGNKTHAAKALGISVRTIRNKLHSYAQSALKTADRESAKRE